MPATAGRVKMPANNRMQTSASLNTHSIWQNAIGYDPYAGEQSADQQAQAEAAQTAQDNMKALLALARTNKAQMEDEKGGWRGSGKLRGGWTAGKDLGEVPKEAPPPGVSSSVCASKKPPEARAAKSSPSLGDTW